jgi:hypothetical protein
MLGRFVLTSILLCSFCGPCDAAKKPKGPPPAVAHLYPCGGKVGSTFACTIGGTLAKSENKVWTDQAGIVFKPTAKPEVFEVTIAPDVPLGAHLVRFYNDEGALPPHVFVVGKEDEVTDKEPNDDFRKPQQIAKIPVTVNGVLEKAGDADTFAFHAVAGRWIVLDLQGYALGSQMDPAMRLLDERGVEVAMSHDTFNLDPFIAFEVKKSGTYMAQIMAFAHPPAADVTLKGSASHVYRLTITDQPFARAAWPCAVQRGTEGKLRTLGWNLGPNMQGSEINVDAGKAIASDELLRMPTLAGELVLASLVDSPVTTETEPNNDLAKAQRIALPATICGCIDAPHDEDRFTFTAKKGQSYEFRVRAFVLHSPLDAWLHVEDKAGKILQQSDDSSEGNFDPSLKWKAPADGDYTLAIGDLFNHGGWDHLYALEAAPPRPSVTASLAASAFKLDAGKTVEVKLTAKLAGDFKGKLHAHVNALPEGVTAKDAEIPAKGGEVKLILTAAASAPAAAKSFEVLISTSEPDSPRTWKAVFDLRSTEPRGDRLINDDTRVWLTVAEKPSDAAPTAQSFEKTEKK